MRAAITLHLLDEMICWAQSYPAYPFGWASAAGSLVSVKDEWEEKSWSCEPSPLSSLEGNNYP